MLSACSEVFEKIFQKCPNKPGIFAVNIISSGDLEALLDFMYKGETCVLVDNFDTFIYAAELLHIKGLGVFDEDSTEKYQEQNEEKFDDTENLELRKNNKPEVSPHNSIEDNDANEEVSIVNRSL